MGLVSGLSLANHSDPESFLVAHALLSQHGCQQEGFWEVVGHIVSPFDLSRTLPVGGGLLVLWKQLMQMFTRVPGQCGRFQSVCFPYHSWLENPHGQKSLAGYSPRGPEESDPTGRLSTASHTHFVWGRELSFSVHCCWIESKRQSLEWSDKG